MYLATLIIVLNRPPFSSWGNWVDCAAFSKLFLFNVSSLAPWSNTCWINIFHCYDIFLRLSWICLGPLWSLWASKSTYSDTKICDHEHFLIKWLVVYSFLWIWSFVLDVFYLNRFTHFIHAGLPICVNQRKQCIEY